jgi:cyclopropane-fatty-acyl-phospholipid synthase
MPGPALVPRPGMMLNPMQKRRLFTLHGVPIAMKALLDLGFRSLVRGGLLEVTYSDGETRTYGAEGARRAHIRFTSPAAQRAIVLDPYLKLGECYVEGGYVIERGKLIDLLMLLGNGDRGTKVPAASKLLRRGRYALRRLQQRNPVGRARRNVAHHYDLSGKLYELFLDSDRQYSCAYFETPDASLEEAQLAKKRHIAAKLLIEPGQRVLDIGCGWGGLALYLARMCDAHVTGITLSQEQLAVAQERARAAGLEDRVEFVLADYRALEGQFDRIVSVGMFEHVGAGHYDTYFDAVNRLLAPDGVMLLHSIARYEPPGITNPFVAKYIFPGGYIPALSEVFPPLERSGLLSTDIEILRLHYAETIAAWRERFEANRERVKALYDERFCRIWECYLMGSEAAFRNGHMMVFQLQLAKDQTAVPLTRSYIEARESALREREAAASARGLHSPESAMA